MPVLTPFVLEPVLVPKPWGGRRLERFGKQLPDDGLFGESWDVADLPSVDVSSSERSRSRVAGGAHAGRTLRELIDSLGADFMGTAVATPQGDFPLLVKLLDASEHLSVQVHPTSEYVAGHDGCHLKTESWYIVDADPGAVIYKGFRPGVTIDEVQAAAGLPVLVDLLQPVPVRPGDFHHLPAGLVHALGAGVLVAEPQTPSDTTFRLYDWTEEYGRESRELHLIEALETLEVSPAGAIALEVMDGDGVRTLIETEHYWQREHDITGGPVDLLPGAELRIVMVVRGHAVMTGPEDQVTDLPLGTTAVIPAAVAGQVVITTTGPTTVLETGLV